MMPYPYRRYTTVARTSSSVLHEFLASLRVRVSTGAVVGNTSADSQLMTKERSVGNRGSVARISDLEPFLSKFYLQ